MTTVDDKALAQLASENFERLDLGGSPPQVRFEKYGCAVVFEQEARGRYRIVAGPGVVVLGELSRLWDAGFQKFLLISTGRHPATAEQLKALHGFEDELRITLDVPSLYNLSLGTTCDVTAYDRVQGRPQSI